MPSKANVADLPSRLEFALLKEMGSQEVKELRWPPATESWLEAVRSAFKEFAPAKRRQEKKWRSEIVEAIEVERRRRAERKRKLDDISHLTCLLAVSRASALQVSPRRDLYSCLS